MVYGVTSGENEKNSLIQVPLSPNENEDISGMASSEYLTRSKKEFGKATPSSFFTWEIVWQSTEDAGSISNEFQSNFIYGSRSVNKSAPHFLGDGGSVQVYGSLSFRRGNFRTLSRCIPIQQAKRERGYFRECI